MLSTELHSKHTDAPSQWRRNAMPGLFFEDFHQGQTFDHALSRTVTEMDNVLFITLTLNPQPLHLDEEFARTTEFGQRIINSLFTLGLMSGVTVGVTTLGTTIANLRTHKVEITSQCGGRGVRTSGVQPACRNGRHLPARRVHETPPRRCLRFLHVDAEKVSFVPCLITTYLVGVRCRRHEK